MENVEWLCRRKILLLQNTKLIKLDTMSFGFCLKEKIRKALSGKLRGLILSERSTEMEGEIGLVWFWLKKERKVNEWFGLYLYREERKFHQIYLLIFVIFFRLVLSLITIVIRLFFFPYWIYTYHLCHHVYLLLVVKKVSSCKINFWPKKYLQLET